ncbi:MAG TPA: hypothetical protein VNY33_08425 [Gaiellaceae bacterium]|jgi:hypothetical protein|nr:hypothetical protein [Gaiellaceae bacterium]
MRSFGLYDVTRGLTTAVAAGAAGVLLWTAALVGQQTTARFWEEMGIVAGAGLVLSLAHAVGGWTKGLRLRLAPGTFVLGFLPVLVCVGWVLLAAQPGNGRLEGRIVSWSQGLGLLGIVHKLGLWNGALAFGFGLVLGLSLEAVPVAELAPVAAAEAPTEAVTAPGDRWAADEPLSAERDAARKAEPNTVVVGPRSD